MTDTIDVGTPDVQFSSIVISAVPAQITPVPPMTVEPPTQRSLALAQGRSRSNRPSWVVPYVRRAIALDALAALTAGLLAATLWFDGRVPITYLVIALASPLVWLVAIASSRGYERRYLGVGPEEFRSLARAAVRLLALTGFASYAMYADRPYLSRGFVLGFFPLALGLSLVLRYWLRQHLHRQRAQGKCLQRTLVVGRADSTEGVIHELQRSPSHGLHVIGACASRFDAEDPAATIVGVPILRGVADTLEAVDLVNAEVVVVSSHSELTSRELRRLSWGLEERDVELIVSPGILEVAGPRLSIRPAAGLSLLHVERPVVEGGRLLSKFVFDRVVAFVIALLILPVMLLVGLAVKLGSPGPVFFRQTRVGARGQTFSMLKFRSMVVDAEQRLDDVASDGNDGNGVLFKQRHDPRVTRVGQFLRRYSLDELPQLINVLRGDMSLVGPRPPLPAEVELYEPDAIRRLRIRPGLTGLWQVSGRSNLTWDESLRLDLRYVDNWSMMLDLQILWRTARAVLKGDGAY